jgi:cytidine deaminase
VLSTQSHPEETEETEEKKEKDGQNDVCVPTTVTEEEEPSPTPKTRTAETRSDSISLPLPVPNEEEKPKRYLEMLVHNVSHTDLVLSVDAPPLDTEEEQEADSEYCLCRPRFSAFDLYCRRILSSIHGQEQVVAFPRFERSETSPRYSIVSPKPSRQGRLHTGFALLHNQTNDLEISKDELSNLRFRGRDAPRIEPIHQNEHHTRLKLSHVFFPLLATLLPRWNRELTTKYASSSKDDVQLKRVIVLVSGVGTPRNWTHSITGNSTQTCAQLMKQFILRVHPQVTVVCIHSNTNIFRYDENIVFVKRELMPCINAYRDAHACGLPYPDEQQEESGYSTIQEESPFLVDWKRSFYVTLSFADGSHARTHAIQTSLRPYRPRYYHLWQLKTFWHDTKIVEDDLEVHSFESMETVPAVDVKFVSAEVQLVIDEIKAFRNDFLESLRHDNDIAQFWLRKTKKPVLAVLLVKKNNKPILYRGTNMEVSMPTGSLCAERNVIGTALASNPALKRQDLKMVAVLAVPLELVQQQQQQQQQQEAVRPSNMPRSSSLASYSSIQEEESDWVIPNDGIPVAKISTTEAELPVYQVDQDFTPRSTPPGTPVRRITLYTQADHLQSTATKPTMGNKQAKLKKTILVHSARDLNPLKPCGACNEWLKKIAESNPHFTVLTFTDADCNGVYVSPCDS